MAGESQLERQEESSVQAPGGINITDIVKNDDDVAMWKRLAVGVPAALTFAGVCVAAVEIGAPFTGPLYPVVAIGGPLACGIGAGKVAEKVDEAVHGPYKAKSK